MTKTEPSAATAELSQAKAEFIETTNAARQQAGLAPMTPTEEQQDYNEFMSTHTEPWSKDEFIANMAEIYEKQGMMPMSAQEAELAYMEYVQENQG